MASTAVGSPTLRPGLATRRALGVGGWRAARWIPAGPTPCRTGLADGQPQQIHLDVYVDDIAAGHAEVMALGARLLRPSAHPEATEGFQFYADPAEHPFCLCWG